MNSSLLGHLIIVLPLLGILFKSNHFRLCLLYLPREVLIETLQVISSTLWRKEQFRVTLHILKAKVKITITSASTNIINGEV